MFSYRVSKNADQKAFDNICTVIENNITIERKEKYLTDVDGSQIQIYKTPNGVIEVFNDYEVDAVYIDSEVKLEKCITDLIY